ncbi:MAG: hypothetical protein KF726_24590 [Anaerolineae bacterium]|nr:hypothetical protein [Anaerolineae bacterium]
MEYPFKLATTGIIWIMAAIMVGTGSSNMSDPFALAVILAVVGAAALATRSIWGGHSSLSERISDRISQRRADRYSARYGDPYEYEKPKRNSKDKLQNMLDALDDDEAAALLEDFRARLSNDSEAASDGEISAVDALRAERRSRR